MIYKPTKEWIKASKGTPDLKTYYFHPDGAILAYQYQLGDSATGLLIQSMWDSNVYRCFECGSLPQLHITKAGKYFLHCPSSFLSGGEECEPGEKYDGVTVIIPKDIPVFDTIKEAIDDWNNFQSYSDVRKTLRQKIVDNEITEWKQIYDYLFGDENESPFGFSTLDPSRQCMELCRLLKINVTSDEALLFNTLTDENWERDEHAFNACVEALCKLTLRMNKCIIKNESETNTSA